MASISALAPVTAADLRPELRGALAGLAAVCLPACGIKLMCILGEYENINLKMRTLGIEGQKSQKCVCDKVE